MPRSAGRSAALVASGIFLSRIAGFVRQWIINRYLGLGLVADALGVSFRIPNLLQNLFGEGVLSASFIPVYARLLSQGRERDAARVAEAVASPAGAGRGRHRGGGGRRDAAGGGRAGAGLHRRQAHARHRPGPDPVSGDRDPGLLRLVPRHSQQPPEVLPLVHRARGLERGDHRRGAAGAPRGRGPAGRPDRVGRRGRQPAPGAGPAPGGAAPGARPAPVGEPRRPRGAHRRPQLLAGARRPRRQPGQRLRGHGDLDACSATARSARWSTRSCSTRCR